MQMFNQVKGYANRANAVRKIKATVADINEVRWMVIVNEIGRFVPVIMIDRTEYMGYAHHGIAVLK